MPPIPPIPAIGSAFSSFGISVTTHSAVLNNDATPAASTNAVRTTCNGHSYININLTLSKMTNFRLFQTEKVCRRQFEV